MRLVGRRHLSLGYGPAELVSFATIGGWTSTLSGREPDLAGRRGIVAGQLLRAPPHCEIKILPEQRDEIEPGRFGRPARGEPGAGVPRAPFQEAVLAAADDRRGAGAARGRRGGG